MSLLYKDRKDVKYSLEVKQDGNTLELLFTSDCGKFGTDEIVDSFKLSNLSLLEVLQKHFEE